MRDQKKFFVSDFSMRSFVRFLALGLVMCLSALAGPPRATAQVVPPGQINPGPLPPTPIPATAAFNDYPVCSDSDLGSDWDRARGNPEWKTIIIDPNLPLLSNPPTIVEGFVPYPPATEGVNDQASSEVAEEDLPWNHYTHDFTFKVVPDPSYQNLMSSWVRYPGVTWPIPDQFSALLCVLQGGTVSGDTCIVVKPEICPDSPTGATDATCYHSEMEVEWENASLMDEGHFQRIWGAVPEFVWPAVGDRVWVSGRWIFDCGHPRVPEKAPVRTYVEYETEIHPPRALVTFRLNHPALDSSPVPRTSAPNFPGMQSFLPVTGQPTVLPPGAYNSGPTRVPVTEADIYVSGNGGGANDLCHLMPNAGDDCGTPHSSPILPVNDRNYVFDIYPPGTNYSLKNGGQLVNGTFPVTPPVPDASLQWRVVDHFSELPAHACGGVDNTVCRTVDPIFCLIDASTPPPDQTELGCPTVPAQPTRLRVILPFADTRVAANYFAQSILLGWDDVPRGGPQTIGGTAGSAGGFLAKSAINISGRGLLNTSATKIPMRGHFYNTAAHASRTRLLYNSAFKMSVGSPLMHSASGVLAQLGGRPGPLRGTPVVRTFRVRLHKFTVEQNGEGSRFLGAPNGDWRVFVNVGGQYRYMDPLYDAKPDGTSVCNGADPLTNNGDGDCYFFDSTPWIVSVQDGTPIHIAVGGWESDRVDSHFCEEPYPVPVPSGCAPFSLGDYIALATANNDRIGTYEFDLKAPAYTPPAPHTTQNTGNPCNHDVGAIFGTGTVITCDELQYSVEFTVQEVLFAPAPASAPLQIGDPHYGNYVSSATPLILSTSSGDAEGFQYRYYRQGGPLPTYPSTQPFPVHWTNAGFPISRGPHILQVFLSGANQADGLYFLQYSAQSFAQLLEPRHTMSLILDNTPPIVSIAQPQAAAYTHSAVLTLGYSANDGSGSGVQGFTPLMDNISTLAGHGLQSGQAINLLTELNLGAHTLRVTAADNVNNAATSSVTFNVIVTPASIQDDVQQFHQSGAIKNSATATTLLARLTAAADARAAGHCSAAATFYRAFIRRLNAQSGNGVSASAAAIMIADAQYLIAHCP
jgi:hypothetical protein